MQTNTPPALVPRGTNAPSTLEQATGADAESQISPHCGSMIALPLWVAAQGRVVVVVIVVVGRVVVVVVVVLVSRGGQPVTSVRFARIDRAAKQPVCTLPSMSDSVAFGAQTSPVTRD